jgi:V8-like Glu-specific endopeptidase
MLALGCASAPAQPFLVRVPAAYGYCAGGMVADGLAITAAHCIGSERDPDLALVPASGQPLDTRYPRDGESVTVYTLRGPVESWIISSELGRAILPWTAQPGDSGSPVVGLDGRIVCTITAYDTRGGSVCQWYY